MPSRRRGIPTWLDGTEQRQWIRRAGRGDREHDHRQQGDDQTEES
ncbi:hypothetical protein ACOTHW_08150 [Achromobacter xylosoxidans]